MLKKVVIHKKFLLKIFAIVATYLLIMDYIGSVFVVKKNHYYAVNSDVTNLPYFSERWSGFYEKDKDTIDAIFLGSSVVHTDVDVNLMYHYYGFTSYDLSADQQSGSSILYFLKEAGKYQSPKLVFIDVQALSHINQNNDTSAHYSFDFMKWGINKIQGIYDLRNSSPENILFPFTKYHNRWEEINKDDFEYMFMDKTNLLNGHFCYMMQNVAEVPVQYEKSDYTLEELGYKDTEECIEKIVNYCQKNDIKCVLMRTPQSYSYGQSKYCDALEKYAEKRGIPFWNFNNYLDEIGTNFSTDFVDGQHMNQIGSERFSRFLGQMIVDNYDMVDHRGELGYEEWDIAYDYEKYLIHDFEIRHYINANEYADNGDFASGNLIYVYTYDTLNDLKSVAGILDTVTKLEDDDMKSNSCIITADNIVKKISLGNNSVWKEENEFPIKINIERISSETKIWFDDVYIQTQETAGIVDLIIYDIKLDKVLDHVTINVNWESNITHLLNI